MIKLNFSNLSQYSRRKMIVSYKAGVLGELLDECNKQNSEDLIFLWSQTKRGHEFWSNLFFKEINKRI